MCNMELMKMFPTVFHLNRYAVKMVDLLLGLDQFNKWQNKSKLNVYISIKYVTF